MLKMLIYNQNIDFYKKMSSGIMLMNVWMKNIYIYIYIYIYIKKRKTKQT